MNRLASQIGRWRKRPRFRPPLPPLLLAVLILAVLLVLRLPRAPASPPRPRPLRSVMPPAVQAVPETPAPLPVIEPAPKGCPEGCAEPPPGCDIKGNISKRGERIYHLPGQCYYDRTIISPGKGEAWFCTEEEARANGWRKARV